LVVTVRVHVDVDEFESRLTLTLSHTQLAIKALDACNLALIQRSSFQEGSM